MIRFFIFLVLFVALIAVLSAQEGEKRRAGAGEGVVILQQSGVSIVVSDGKVLVNGREMAKVRKGEPVSVVVLDGKVFVNGKEIELPKVGEKKIELKEAPAPDRRIAPAGPDFNRLMELLRRHYDELPGEVKDFVERWQRWVEEFRKQTEQWRERVEGEEPAAPRAPVREVGRGVERAMGEFKRMMEDVDRRLEALRRMMEEMEEEREKEGEEGEGGVIPQPAELREIVETFVRKLVERIREEYGDTLQEKGIEFVERFLERLSDEDIDRLLDVMEQLTRGEKGREFRERMMERMIDRFFERFFKGEPKQTPRKHQSKERERDF
ncbi:MAG: hypothetical protein N2234_10030 [Planctomycetota bacterium]|nr:hypothetical protein [Planctomycetota bacterium]